MIELELTRSPNDAASMSSSASEPFASRASSPATATAEAGQLVGVSAAMRTKVGESAASIAVRDRGYRSR